MFHWKNVTGVRFTKNINNAFAFFQQSFLPRNCIYFSHSCGETAVSKLTNLRKLTRTIFYFKKNGQLKYESILRICHVALLKHPRTKAGHFAQKRRWSAKRAALKNPCMLEGQTSLALNIVELPEIAFWSTFFGEGHNCTLPFSCTVHATKLLMSVWILLRKMVPVFPIC